jgi:hypothetical protein
MHRNFTKFRAGLDSLRIISALAKTVVPYRRTSRLNSQFLKKDSVPNTWYNPTANVVIIRVI